MRRGSSEFNKTCLGHVFSHESRDAAGNHAYIRGKGSSLSTRPGGSHQQCLSLPALGLRFAVRLDRVCLQGWSRSAFRSGNRRARPDSSPAYIPACAWHCPHRSGSDRPQPEEWAPKRRDLPGDRATPFGLLGCWNCRRSGSRSAPAEPRCRVAESSSKPMRARQPARSIELWPCDSWHSPFSTRALWSQKSGPRAPARGAMQDLDIMAARPHRSAAHVE
jgi:hypothetical protein